MLQSGHISAINKHFGNIGVFIEYQDLFRNGTHKNSSPFIFPSESHVFIGVSGVKGAFQPFITLHHIINQRLSWISLYIFLAEISVLSTESYLCVNIENMNKEQKVLKIRQLWFSWLKNNVYKALMSYDLGPYKRTIASLLSYDMGLYSRTTWDHNKALLVFFDAKSCKKRIVFMLKSISWELHRLKTSWQNQEGNTYNEERHSFLSYSHPGLTAGANSSFY